MLRGRFDGLYLSLDGPQALLLLSALGCLRVERDPTLALRKRATLRVWRSHRAHLYISILRHAGVQL